MGHSLKERFSRQGHPFLLKPAEVRHLRLVGAEKDPDLSTAYALPVSGQGVFAVTTRAAGPFRIVMSSPGSLRAVVLKLENGKAILLQRNELGVDKVLAAVADEDCDAPAGVEPGEERTYWLSLDTRNFTLVYGKGYAAAQFAFMKYRFEVKADEDPEEFWTAGIRRVKLGGRLGEVSAHHVQRYPATFPVPAVIKGFADVTMDDVAAGGCLVASEMPEETQALYGTVGGPRFQLDTPDFPDFSAAINHSIDTPGCICYDKLLEKYEKSPFSKDPHENYLRITLGPDLGDSPGIPYVLELWPKQNFSPIHNHADAYAVIKVLHGTIWVQVFPEFSTTWPEDACVEYEFPQGGVTWLSPDCFQTHRLKNRGTETMTATIQCYRYPDADDAHYEYFDYIAENDGKRVVEQFLPDSDFDFVSFKAEIRAEWEKAKMGKK